MSGVMSKFARAKARAAGAPEKYVYLFWDSNIRVGRLQESESSIRGGENVSPDDDARHLIDELDKAGACIVHGRSCPWDYTFEPIEPRRGKSVIDYVITDDLSGIFSAGVATREQADISSDHRALFVRVDAGPIEATRRKNGRARRRDAVSRCPYSRRRLREAPEEVNELVTREIERRIADGQISRAQCMDTHWDWLKHAVLDAAAEAAPARSGRRPMKPGFDVRRQTRCADDDRRDLDLELRGLANGSS